MIIEETYKQMTNEEKKHSKTIDFEQLKDEITDDLQQFVDMIHFKKADIEDYAIIDTTMITIHTIASEGKRLIKKRHE